MNIHISTNPKVDDFLKEHPKLTLLGLAWAGYWRLALVFMAVYVVILVGVVGLAALFS